MLTAYSDITRSRGIGRRISRDDPTRNVRSVFPVTKLEEACTGEERVSSESVVFGHEYKFDGNGLLGERDAPAIGRYMPVISAVIPVIGNMAAVVLDELDIPDIIR